MFHKIINVIHIIYVAPLLIYSGYIGRKTTRILEEDTVSKPYRNLFNILIVTGLIDFLYHIYKLIK